MGKFVAFMAGIVGGALAGWYGTKKYYKTKCDMEIQSMRELCDRTSKAANERAENAEVKAQRAADDRQIFAEALTRLGYAGDRDPSVVEKHAHPQEDSYHLEPDELEVPTEKDLQQIEQQRKQPPMMIDENTFAQDIYSGFDKKEVLWYPEDQILLDGDTNELMDDPYSFLGNEWKEAVEECGEAYVRNFRWEVDYAIIKSRGKGLENMTIPATDV